jgi:hypothetical protein
VKRIQTQIDIAAPPEQVWQHLTDFESYPDWNPFVRSLEGSPAPGARLRVEMLLPGKDKSSAFKPSVTAAEPNRTFEWLGSIGIKGLFDGRHRFDLSPTDGGTRLEHSETFTGILVRPILALIGGKTEEGFNAMNQALQERVERAQDGTA